MLDMMTTDALPVLLRRSSSSIAGCVWLGSALGLLTLTAYAYIVNSPGWEAFLVRGLQGLSIPGLHSTDLLLTRVGHTPWALPLTAAAVILLTIAGHVRLGAFLVLLTLGRFAGGLVKLLVERSRPDPGQVDLAYVFGGHSFPSGHVLGTTLLLGWLCYAAVYAIPQRTLRLAFQAACGVIMLLMGISRVELGAHWPTDVLAGYLLALLLLIPVMSWHRALHLRGASIIEEAERVPSNDLGLAISANR